MSERDVSSDEVDAKLAVIRRAVNLEKGGREVDIDRMLAETEAGRSIEIDVGFLPSRPPA